MLPGFRGRIRRARSVDQCADERRRRQIPHDFAYHGLFQSLPRHIAAAHPVGIRRAFPVIPCARRRAQQPGEQILAAGAALSLGAVGRERRQNAFGFGFGDEGLVGIALDLPFRSRAPAVAANGVTAAA